MSRFFNGGFSNDYITFAASSAAPPDQGPITMMGLVRAESTSGTHWLVEAANSAGSGTWGLLIADGALYCENNYGPGGPTAPVNQWFWVACTKVAGSAAPRWHVKNLDAGTAWVHVDDTYACSDGSGPTTDISVGQAATNHTGSGEWRGQIAAVAVFDRVLSDAEIETAAASAAALKAANPAWGTLLNQTSTSVAATDLSGNGGDQTAISGTSIDASEPPGWSYATEVTYVGYNTVFGSSSSTLTVSKPGATAQDDMLVAFVSGDWSAYSDIAPPDASWVFLTGQNGATNAGTHIKVFWKKATASEPASYTFTPPAPPSASIVSVHAFRGVDWGGGASPTISAAIANSATSVAPAVTAGSAGDLLLCTALGDGQGSSVIWTQPSGMTLAWATASGGYTTQAVAYQALATGGSTGTRTFTTSGGTVYYPIQVSLTAAVAGTGSGTITLPAPGVSRFFNGGATPPDSIDFAASSAAPPDEGPITMMILARSTATSGTRWLLQGTNASVNPTFGLLTYGGKFFCENNGGPGGPSVPLNEWFWVAVTKAAGSVAPRWHVKNLDAGTAWVHVDDTYATADGTGPTTAITVGANKSTASGSGAWMGQIAAVAAFDRVLSDAEIETATGSAQALHDALPSWGTLLNQESTGTAATDLAGQGGDQTAISGTTVASTQPPGWSYAVSTTYRGFGSIDPSSIDPWHSDSAVTLGTEFYVTQAGLSVSQLRFAMNGGTTTARQVGLYRVSDQALIAGPYTVTPSSGTGWFSYDLPSPVGLDANVRYRVATWHPNGFSSTPHYFDSGPGATDIVNGPLVVPTSANATGQNQGSYYYGGSFGFPNAAWVATNYWNDVTVSGGTSPTTGSANLSGDSTLNATGTPSVQGSAAAPAGSGSVAAQVRPAVSTTAGLAGSGSLAAAGTPALIAGIGPVAADGTLIAAGVPGYVDSIGLSGNGTVDATAAPRAIVDVDLQGDGALGSIDSPALAVDLALAAVGTVEAVGTPSVPAAAFASGDAVLNVAALVQFSGTADLAGGGTVAAAMNHDITISGLLLRTAWSADARIAPHTATVRTAWTARSHT